jgi:hypothetical protein
MLQGTSSKGLIQREGRCTLSSQAFLNNARAIIGVVGAFLIAFAMVGCGGMGGPENVSGRDGERDAATTYEETSAPKADRSAAKTTQEPAGLDVERVTPDKA